MLIMQDDGMGDGGRTFLRNAGKNFIPRGISIQKTAFGYVRYFHTKISCNAAFTLVPLL